LLVLRHDGLLREITEGRMSGKPTSGRRRIHMLHAFAMDYAYIALQRELQRMEKTGDTVEGEENCSVLECYQ